MKIHELINLVKKLRENCPWDKRQTLQSIKNNVVEEAYEVVEAIENGSTDEIREEIGDILFLGIFLATIFEQEKGVNIDELIASTVEKFKNKHPHVFKNIDLPDQDAVLKYWQETKSDMFDGIPKILPALMAAKVTQERAAQFGFDWHSYEGPLKKVEEEICEVKKSITSKKTFEEFGDLLFACVNLARHLGFDPEQALRHANEKFAQRFREVKKELEKRSKNIEDVSLEEMDHIWDEIKQKQS